MLIMPPRQSAMPKSRGGTTGDYTGDACSAVREYLVLFSPTSILEINSRRISGVSSRISVCAVNSVSLRCATSSSFCRLFISCRKSKVFLRLMYSAKRASFCLVRWVTLHRSSRMIHPPIYRMPLTLITTDLEGYFRYSGMKTDSQKPHFSFGGYKKEPTSIEFPQ